MSIYDRLAREGARVLICARRESALAQAAEDIHATTAQEVEVYPLDVTKPEEIANLIVFALSDAATFVNGAVLVADNAQDKS